MKKGYKIGLFFICIIILAVIVLLLLKRQSMKQEQLTPEEPVPVQEDSGRVYQEDPEGTPVQGGEQVMTCDTLCLYEDVDRKDGSVLYEETAIPAKYIGMNRKELEAALEEDAKILSLEDKQKGFVSQHLTVFSAERIKIVRIYDTTPEEEGFYIMAVDHQIWIYQKDKTTLYFKTDLKLSDLPQALQQEIVKGKYMNSELEIYHFLESYSS